MKYNASQRHWVKTTLPDELTTLSMAQLTAVRKMVQAAFTAGRKHERKLMAH